MSMQLQALFALFACVVGDSGPSEDSYRLMFEDDEGGLSLLQSLSRNRKAARRGTRDLAFVHVPMNFGNSIALTAAVGSGSNLTYGQVSATAQAGWDNVTRVLQPGAPAWGPLNPDLQTVSDLGFPMYYTPQKHWPSELAQQYFGNRTVFGILRDPYERVVALYRGSQGGAGAKGTDFVPDGRVCDVNSFVQDTVSRLISDPSSVNSLLRVQLQVQADFFEGAYGITLPIDLDEFPRSANEVLSAHGYDVNLQLNDIMHVTDCSNTWSGDLSNHSKSLIHQYYLRDFALRCEHFGYCDDMRNACLTHVPGMCPEKLFTWDDASALYSPRL